MSSFSCYHGQHVFAVAFCGGIAVGISIAVALQWRFSSRHFKVDDSSSTPTRQKSRDSDHPSNQSSTSAAAIELEKEQLSRTTLFLGEEGVEKLKNSSIVVIGLGGVGSHAAHMLVRSGCRRIRLVDFDMVTLSSLNRHAVATRDDVGQPKVTVCARHFKSISPNCEIDARVAMFTAADAAALLDGSPDYVVDCIDDVKTKADLLAACRSLRNSAGQGVRVMCALGAGGKADPTRVLVADLADAVKDPLAMSLKREMRFRLNAAKQEQTNYLDHIKVIYSSEKQVVRLGELDADQAQEPDAFGAVPGFRIRTMPVIGTMPAVFGLMAASSIMCEVTLPWDFGPCARCRELLGASVTTFLLIRMRCSTHVFGAGVQIAGKPLNPRRVEQIAQSHQRKLRTKLLQREMYATRAAMLLATLPMTCVLL
eukprot:m.760350 g.760350  ORF g.760350 m.760350 type:complete len:425 (-) comp23200_c1_seq2:1395-2669(-)